MSLQETDNNVVRRKSKRLSMIDGAERKSKFAKIEIINEIGSPVDKNDNDDPNFSICEGSETKTSEQTTSNDSIDKSSLSKGNEIEKKYSEDQKICICDHCKSSVVDNDHKMIGCLICSKYYHIDCFLPCDRPTDVVFERNQFIRKKLGCIRCSIVLLCYKIRDIVTWRWREQAHDVEDPAKYFMPREFLVQYRFLSYWDSEWISELQYEMSEINFYRSYRKRVNFLTPPLPNILSDGHKRKMSTTDLELHEKYFKWGIETEWLQPQRVVALDDVGCIVKWRGLNYDFNSTEPLTRVDNIDGLKEAIEAFKNLKEDLTNENFVPVDKSKLTKLLESPDYLGPLNSTDKDKPSLHPYQLEGLNWLRSSYSNDVNTILADEMGLGKTIQAIAFLYSLFKDNVSKGPFLVAVPLSTIKNWEREFEFWAPDLCVLSYYGDKDCRKEIKNFLFFNSKKKKVPAFHVLLTTYELIYFDDTILHSFNWDVLIIDEAQRLKNNESKLFKTFKKYKIKYRNLMTGTPLQNNLEELFHLLNFMEPQSFGDESSFMSQFQDVSKEEQVKTLQGMLKKHILRRLKIDVLKNLPSKEEQIVRLELTPLQKEFYKMVLTKNFDVLGGKYSNMKMINIVMHLRKVCNHPFLNMNSVDDQMKEDGSYDVKALVSASGKMELLQKMLIKLRSTGHRVLIFSGMTKLLDLVEHMLEDIEIQYERLDGSISSVSRQSAIDRFNDPESQSMVFLLSTKAGGLGINLSSADTVIIYDSDWNPHNDIQALSRAHRIGQLKKVMIYRFVTRNTVEEKIMETSKKKMMITNLVVKNCTKNEFHQILSFGTKELFDENAADDQKIIYDDAALDVLLDRNRPEVVSRDGDLVDECFSGFKVADCQFAADNDAPVTKSQPNINENVTMIYDMKPEDYWTKLLEPLVKDKSVTEVAKEPELGKGLRHKNKMLTKKSLYDENNLPPELSDVVVPESKEAVDTEYEASEDESQDEEFSGDDVVEDNLYSKEEEKVSGPTFEYGKGRIKYDSDKDFKRLVSFGLDNDAARMIGLSGTSDKHLEKFNRFWIVDGFMPVERMDIYTALMNYGLPPKILRKSDFWWPGTLQHKTADEMHRFISNLMKNICEGVDSKTFPDGVPKDDIDYDLLIARIGLNAVIGFKVNQFEVQNRVILETLSYKQFNIQTQSIDEIKSVFSDVADSTFEFNIWDGEFSKIHSLWREYDSKRDSDITKNPIFEWNRLHDYELLSAMALYGYDNYLDQIFQDPQFHLLFVPFKLKNIEMHRNNFEIRKFIRQRQVILENALLVETQMIKISMLFDGTSSDLFSVDKLKFFHDMFVKQSGNYYVNQSNANTKLRMKAIAQLELLINDIECDTDSYRPIEIRKIDH